MRGALDRSAIVRKSSSVKMNELSESLSKMQTRVGSGLQEIESISSTIRQIREKAKVINDIVFQTKLLSFNASVEAARAGEHGRGFSVVAQEIGKLAALSGQSASEIEQILNDGLALTSEKIQKVSSSLTEALSEMMTLMDGVKVGRGEVSELFAHLEAKVLEGGHLAIAAQDQLDHQGQRCEGAESKLRQIGQSIGQAKESIERELRMNQGLLAQASKRMRRIFKTAA